MSCRLIRNISHSGDYNPGGITEIYLLDIRDFVTYKFTNDSLYDSCDVDRVVKEKDTAYIMLGAVAGSNFTESNDNGLFRQQLTTFAGTPDHRKTSDSLMASTGRYVVFFRTAGGKIYSFGSDGGASFSFTQVSGQTGEAAGYNITLSKNSIYPLFEVDAYKFNKILVLGTENRMAVSTENKRYAILI